MKYLTLLIIGTLFVMNVSAQDQIFNLHPIVGDTIDAQEMSYYMLFQDYELDSIDYLLLTKIDSVYTVNGFAKNAKVINIRLKPEEIELQKDNIEKLNKYFSTVCRNDSIDNRILTSSDSISSQEINMDIMTPELLKDIKKKNRWKRLSDYRQEVNKNREKGMIY